MILLIIGMVGITGCTMHGYRYPCQNPDNWTKPACNYPECTIEGTCPNDVLPRCGTQLGRMCSDVYG